MRSTISVVISAYNEEKKIERCLDSVKWVDEIIIIDNTSSDATAMRAKKYTKHVFKKKNNLMLNVNKNYGFSKATSDWILNLDADEEVSPELQQEIQRTLEAEASEINGYWMARKNILFGKWIERGLWWPDKQLRLFRRGKGKFPEVNIHEYIQVEGVTADLTEPFLHHNYETIEQYIQKIDRCTTSEMMQLKNSGYRIEWYDALRFPLSDFNKIFFAQEGYKDGLHGLVLAILQSIYSFFVFAKLWEDAKYFQQSITVDQVNEELKNNVLDLSYWQKTASMKETKNIAKKTLLKIQRKIERRKRT